MYKRTVMIFLMNCSISTPTHLVYFYIFYSLNLILKLFDISCKMFQEKEKDPCPTVQDIRNPIPSEIFIKHTS